MSDRQDPVWLYNEKLRVLVQYRHGPDKLPAGWVELTPTEASAVAVKMHAR